MSRQPVDVVRVRCDSLRSPLQVCGQVDAVPSTITTWPELAAAIMLEAHPCQSQELNTQPWPP